MRKLLFVIFVTFIFGGTAFYSSSQDSIELKYLLNQWKHSYEEQTDSVLIYRPSYFKEFPRARFRHAYEFLRTGECLYFAIARDDRNTFKSGYWGYNSEDQILEISNSQGQVFTRYKIISLNENLLRMTRVKK